MEWVFFAALMALYAAYSANIVVLLQTPSNSIQTLRQLYDSKITLAANDVDYNRFVFDVSIDFQVEMEHCNLQLTSILKNYGVYIPRNQLLNG